MRLIVCLIALFTVADAAAAESRKVAIIVHDGVELLDFAGPGEVFSAAPGGAFEVFTVGPTAAPVTSQGFVKITPDFSIDNAPKPDLIVIPGGHTATLYDDPKMMAWLKAHAATAEVTMSVCNGAITLAKTGLLDGLTATTHWGALPALRKFPRITVAADERFTDNGRIVTTQGVSAGIDGALHVVERLLGSEAAWRDARYMMYHWEPSSLSAQAKAEWRPFIDYDWTKVAAIYQRKLDDNPKDVQAAVRLGIAQKELGDNAHAVTTLERAVALGTRDPDALDELGDAHLALGHFEAAAHTYERELPLRWSQAQPDVGMSVARAWAHAGNKDAAFAALQRWAPLAGVSHEMLEKDPHLQPLRSDARFASLRGK